ncbi:hypothetical protein ACFL1T_03535 [Chlamydiota bacterium]
MFYLVIHIYQEQYIEDILLTLTGLGVRDVQVTTTVNESRRLAHNMPLFAGYKEKLGIASPYSKVLSAIVNDEKVPERLIKSLNNVGINFINEDLGDIMLLPIVKSYKKELSLSK